MASYIAAPVALNINFGHFVWPPLARMFPAAWLFQTALMAVVAAVLALAELAIRKLWRPGPAAAAQPAAS